MTLAQMRDVKRSAMPNNETNTYSTGDLINKCMRLFIVNLMKCTTIWAFASRYCCDSMHIWKCIPSHQYFARYVALSLVSFICNWTPFRFGIYFSVTFDNRMKHTCIVSDTSTNNLFRQFSRSWRWAFHSVHQLLYQRRLSS